MGASENTIRRQPITRDQIVTCLANANTASMLTVVGIGAIDRITDRADVNYGQMVEFMGRSSNHQRVEVGGLGATYRLKKGTDEFCFKNLFELRPHRTIFGGLRCPVQGGDSGAWVCDQFSAGRGWCGMAIGEDGVQGFACYAETVKKWVENTLSHPIRVC